MEAVLAVRGAIILEAVTGHLHEAVRLWRDVNVCNFTLATGGEFL